MFCESELARPSPPTPVVGGVGGEGEGWIYESGLVCTSL